MEWNQKKVFFVYYHKQINIEHFNLVIACTV